MKKRKKNTPFFSVIVPVYNNEDDIEKCISSILAQTYDDFELIIVDDGSTDKTPDICDDFAQKDERIRVIHRQGNGGVTAARNEGLFYSSGEYIYHVDGDDWIAEKLLETAKNRLDKASIDIFVFCHVKVLENNQYQKRKLRVEEGLYDKERLKKQIYPWMIFQLDKKGGIDSGSLCDKVIKRKLLQKHYCSDTSLFRGEYCVCAWECLYFADNVYFSEEMLYFYNRLSETSGQKKYRKNLLENEKAIAKYLRSSLKVKEDFEIERQINMLEFYGIVRSIHQEINFHHSFFSSAQLLKMKCKGERDICCYKGMPLKIYPYVLLINHQCFLFLMMCVILKKYIYKLLCIFRGWIIDI